MCFFLAADAEAQIIRGVVVDERTGDAVRAAAVSALLPWNDSVAARTEADRGVFQLRLPADGVYRVRVEALGYATAHSEIIAVAPGMTVTVELRLRVNALPLEPLRVIGERREPFWLPEIRDREQRGFGTFLYREQLDERADSELAELFQSLGGIWVEQRTIPRSSRRIPYVSMRRSVTGGWGECPARLVLNGAPQPMDGESVLQFMDMRPADIEAIEIYRGPAELPAEFAGTPGSECGLIAVWLRTGYDPNGRRLRSTRLRMQGGGGHYDVSGPLSPGAGMSLSASGDWSITGPLWFTIELRTTQHVLAANTTYDLMLVPMLLRWDELGYVLPAGPRDMRIVAASLGPRAELWPHARVSALVGINMQLARRAFSIERRFRNDRDTEFSSYGVGGGASAAARVALAGRVALEAGAYRDWIRFQSYNELDLPDRSTGGTWRGTGVRAALVYTAR